MLCALALLLAGLFCIRCGALEYVPGLHIDCYHTGSRISDGPFAVAIKPFPDPVVPLLDGRPAKEKAGGVGTTVRLTNTSAGPVTVLGDLSGYLIDGHGHVASAWPLTDTAVAAALVPLQPGQSRTLPVGVNVERCDTGQSYGHSLPAGRYRMRVQVVYTVGGADDLRTIDSTTTVPVVLR